MMPVIRISDSLYERLQKHAVPFVDTPATVIERWGEAYERQQEGTACVDPPSVNSVLPEPGAAEMLGVSCRQTAGHEKRPTVRATLGYLKDGQTCNSAIPLTHCLCCNEPSNCGRVHSMPPVRCWRWFESRWPTAISISANQIRRRPSQTPRLKPSLRTMKSGTNI